MHAVILGQIKAAPPMDESIMAPIRAKCVARRKLQHERRKAKAVALAILARLSWLR
jgi:hypothetical protein